MPPGFYKRMIYENRLIEIRQLCLFDFAIMSVLLSNSQIEKMKKMHEARKKTKLQRADNYKRELTKYGQ